MLDTDTLYTLCEACNGYGVQASFDDGDGPSGIVVCDGCKGEGLRIHECEEA